MNKQILLVLVALISGFLMYAQEIELKGEIYDEYLEPFPNAIVKASNGKTTTTDYDGTFTIKAELPITIRVTSIGFSSESIEVTSIDDQISLILKENSGLEQVVLSASRSSERLFESQASVERISLNDIRKTSSMTFYESLENLRGVDVRTNSLLLKSINTRGFSPIENTRVVQLIDGVDNVFPSATISMGNLTGLVDMDVENVEVLSGAASALYGANAFNGVVLIKSKNPFDYQGLSAKFQGGFINQNTGSSAFYNPSVRLAYKFSDNFAAKASFSYYTGNEWNDHDYRNVLNGKIVEGTRDKEDYNGLNVYGDEYKFNQKGVPFLQFLQAELEGDPVKSAAALGFFTALDAKDITRTGYNEEYFASDKIKNIKFNTSLNYRPFGNEKLEIGWTSRFSTPTSLFSYGSSKFAVENAQLNQHILNVKGESFFVRGYVTNVDLGDSYSLQILPAIINESYKPTAPIPEKGVKGWVIEYMEELSKGKTNKEAREVANIGRYEPGSNSFNNAINTFKKKPISKGGAKFEDNSKMYQAEGNFNFNKYVDFIEIQLGGMYREYILDQPGILNYDNIIHSYEYGMYAQLRKKILDNRLNVMGSLRYDDSKNFEGRFSPRVAISYTLGKDKNHLIRTSVQTAFRTATIQSQYANLNKGGNAFTIGNTEDNLNQLEKLFVVNAKSITTVDRDFLTHSGFTKKSFDKFNKNFLEAVKKGDGFEQVFVAADKQIDKKKNGVLKTTKIQQGLRPESLTSFELGYRGILSITATNVLEIDFGGYYNQYKDFISYEDIYIPGETKSTFGVQADATEGQYVPVPANPTIYDMVGDPYNLAVLSVLTGNAALVSMSKNNKETFSSYGLGVSLKTRIFNNFKVGANYNWNDFNYNESENSSYVPRFNTSKHNVKFMLGNSNVIKNIGFNVAGRWQSKYLWISDFGSGDIEARTVFDGHISYAVPKMKSRFKIGGTNLLGKSYTDNIGNGKIGSMYYLAWIIND